jgi:hypothetical protein
VYEKWTWLDEPLTETCPYALVADLSETLVADLSETHTVVQLIADAQADVDYRLAEGSRRNPRG